MTLTEASVKEFVTNFAKDWNEKAYGSGGDKAKATQFMVGFSYRVYFNDVEVTVSNILQHSLTPGNILC